jgi:hypothetical protein
MAFRNRICLVTDIAGYSSRTVPERADAERRLARVQHFALARARAFRVQTVPREDRGDGQLLLLPPLLDPTTAIPALVAGLRHALQLANSDPGPFGRLRIRVSMAQGAIQQRAPLGPRGDALITACRLNDAEPLKQALARRDGADLAFIVPDDIYRDVIRHDFGSLRSAEFTRVQISVKEYDGTAWMYLPASGPVQEAADAAAASMWRATASGSLIAGIALFAVCSPDPASTPAEPWPSTDVEAGHAHPAFDVAAGDDTPDWHLPGRPDQMDDPDADHHDLAQDGDDGSGDYA